VSRPAAAGLGEGGRHKSAKKNREWTRINLRQSHQGTKRNSRKKAQKAQKNSREWTRKKNLQPQMNADLRRGRARNSCENLSRPAAAGLGEGGRHMERKKELRIDTKTEANRR
jgi:hypothetical protein